MASFARVVMFDKRGTGMSDRVTEMPGLDQRMDDLRAVMDAVAMEQAAVLGLSEGGSLAALFAATYPHRCSALILYGAFARFWSWFPTEEAFAQFLGYVDQAWGSGGAVPFSCPHEPMIRPSSVVCPFRTTRREPGRRNCIHAHEQPD